VRQPLAQPDRDHLLQPGLGHHQHQQAASDDQEDHELGHEDREVLLLDRVVEGALPAVQPDLPDGVQADHGNDAGRQETDRAPVPRRAKRIP
jgi:hypothetical protein